MRTTGRAGDRAGLVAAGALLAVAAVWGATYRRLGEAPRSGVVSAVAW